MRRKATCISARSSWCDVLLCSLRCCGCSATIHTTQTSPLTMLHCKPCLMLLSLMRGLRVLISATILSLGTKHTMLGPLLEVEMSKKCTPLWREAHFQVKMYKAHHVRTIFGGSDVEKVHAVVVRSTFRSQNVKNTRGSDHFWRFRCRFAPLHYTTLQIQLHNYIPLHSTTLRYTKLHYVTLHYITLHSTTLHYTTLHSTTLQLQLHSTTLRYTPLH